MIILQILGSFPKEKALQQLSATEIEISRGWKVKFNLSLIRFFYEYQVYGHLYLKHQLSATEIEISRGWKMKLKFSSIS
jgi:hypothetical protein